MALKKLLLKQKVGASVSSVSVKFVLRLKRTRMRKRPKRRGWKTKPDGARCAHCAAGRVHFSPELGFSWQCPPPQAGRLA